MKTLAVAVLLGAVMVSVVALVIAHQHQQHRCKQQGFVTKC